MPVSVSDIQTTMKIRVSLADNEFTQRIKTATTSAERFCNRCFVAQTWDMFLDGAPYELPSIFTAYSADSAFGGYNIEIIKPPMLSMIGVFVTDDSGTETQVPDGVFWPSTSLDPGRISLTPGNVWPYHRGFEGFRVRFIAGYAYPFKVINGVISAPRHGLISGQVVRVQTAQGPLPDGLEADTDYTVSAVGPGTLQLLDDTGTLVALGDMQTYSFLGEIPEPIRRAIVITAGLEVSGDIPNKQAEGTSARYAPVLLPITALELLRPFRFISV